MQLDGTQSASFDGKPLTYQWSLGSTSLFAQLANANTATPTVFFEGGQGMYVFTLTVTDSAGSTATDTVTVWFY
jgi:hypothetical protein